ncbi:MAG: hypothetical protein NT166_14540 [Candidatus Aminicenantes bacterium]|nr:hypothetical protein [Candidatus Aminicenantes bacterium]
MAEQIRIAERKAGGKTKAPVPGLNKSWVSEQNSSYIDRVMDLQRTVGNREVTRLIRSGFIRAKLTIGRPGDIYEQEADRIADRVMRMTGEKQSLVSGHSSLVQRQSPCPGCEEEEKPISRKTSGGGNLLAHELTLVVQQAGDARTKIRRQAGAPAAACNPCPNPVNPSVNVSIRPRVRNVVLPSNGIAETPWNTANVTFVSVWHRERRNCNTCAAPGGTMDGWDLCARSINILATVNMDINQAEINRVGAGGERWHMDCGNTAMGAAFITRANAMTTLTTPRRYTIAGGRAHEGYHVQVSERLLRDRIRARNDIRQICPYSATVIATWKTNLETAIKNDANTFLRGNPQEPNEERNANAAACPSHAAP